MLCVDAGYLVTVQCGIYVYRGPSGEKLVTNSPQTGSGYRLLATGDSAASLAPFVTEGGELIAISQAAGQGDSDAHTDLGLRMHKDCTVYSKTTSNH